MKQDEKWIEKIKNITQKTNNDFDAKENVWLKIEQRLDQKNNRTQAILWKKIALAAILLFFISLIYQFFNPENSINTNYNPRLNEKSIVNQGKNEKQKREDKPQIIKNATTVLEKELKKPIEQQIVEVTPSKIETDRVINDFNDKTSSNSDKNGNGDENSNINEKDNNNEVNDIKTKESNATRKLAINPSHLNNTSNMASSFENESYTSKSYSDEQIARNENIDLNKLNQEKQNYYKSIDNIVVIINGVAYNKEILNSLKNEKIETLHIIKDTTYYLQKNNAIYKNIIYLTLKKQSKRQQKKLNEILEKYRI